MSEFTPRRKNNAELTRQKILASAVKQFGAHGFQGASLRTIVSEAGVNLAAANYHFGSKAKLYFAVIENYFEMTRDIRLQNLSDTDLLPETRGRLKALVRGYIAPHINLVITEHHHDYGRLITQVLNDNKIVTDELFAREVNKVRLPFKEKLHACCPGLDDELVARGIGMVVAVMAYAPFDPSYQTLTNISPLDQPAEEIIEGAVSFSYGGLYALFELD